MIKLPQVILRWFRGTPWNDAIEIVIFRVIESFWLMAIFFICELDKYGSSLISFIHFVKFNRRAQPPPCSSCVVDTCEICYMFVTVFKSHDFFWNFLMTAKIISASGKVAVNLIDWRGQDSHRCSLGAFFFLCFRSLIFQPFVSHSKSESRPRNSNFFHFEIGFYEPESECGKLLEANSSSLFRVA